MRFFADLHIHSKYSRATSRDCDLTHLALWARRKGIAVLGSGDFTHPAWLAAIAEETIEAEPGLRRLTPELERRVNEGLDQPNAMPRAGESTRFMLTVEISTIYKKGDFTRKVHHVIGVPSLEAAKRLNQRLGRIGNLNSDGRPILGLDSRNLLEITLEADPDAFLIPAHIWTPWFSALGSKSGFDSIQECYGDLADHIFAVETGLSSDPPMNWRIASLDRYRLVSNSDAHSPSKVAREATVFTSAMDYFAMVRALKTGDGYAGTVEFFPEEGKYHLDGHRDCRVCLDPVETKRLNGLCPVCGKGVTVGVLNRVEELAVRPEGGERPATAAPFLSMIPLPEIIAEVEGMGVTSNRVNRAYDELLRRLGPELSILEEVPVEEIRTHGSVRLAEAIARVRRGEVIRSGGYDGEFGVIRVFSEEKRTSRSAAGLFVPGEIEERAPEKPTPPRKSPEKMIPARMEEKNPRPTGTAAPATTVDGLDEAQALAAGHGRGPLLILAGPGTGKTRTLTHRLAGWVRAGGVPESGLAVTFTRRAAEEMRERLGHLMDETVARRIPVMTFHALGWSLIRRHAARFDASPGVTIAAEAEAARRLMEDLGVTRAEAGKRLEQFSRLRREGIEAGDPKAGELTTALAFHRAALRKRGLVELEDLVALPVAWLDGAPDLVAELRARHRAIFVDEFQDIDASQYALLRHLVAPDGDLCAIGDPDQSIYGFRGGSPVYFDSLARDFPTLATVRLTRNYRSGQAIVRGALAVMARANDQRERDLMPMLPDARRIVLHAAASDQSEAEFVVSTIEGLMGGHGFQSLSSGQADGHASGEYAFADFAVLYRSDALAAPLCQALERSGIPYQKRSHARLREHAGVKSLSEALAKRGGSGVLVERLNAVASLTAPGDPDVAQALAWLMPMAERHGSDLEAFLAEIALGAEVDWLDPRAERVALLTMHGSKGLEYRVVFVIGCEDGMVPWRFGDGDEETAKTVEEERRLLFVAMTRAKETLFVSWSRKRFWRGAVQTRTISPFLEALEEGWIERRKGRVGAPRKSKPMAGQLSLNWG
ncbi:ATP-dependent DNA helicase Rep [Candidatus Magnetaquicoccaceae bacterium FCR-1]|uniref:ATP-dependent DNA helicase Rep n=1 Tax=Candidatus Magnetaquiglobus chichijimensis TaxID=3141448 RepID=A0ABQ0C7R1_9PROT